MNEPELIADSQKGDVDSFNRLVLAYQGLVYSVAYRMVSNRDVASDITQDTFLSAFRALRGFRGGSFKAWLLRIATNACYDYHRARRRRPTDSLDEMVEDDAAGSLLQDRQPGPEEQALRGETGRTLQRGLAALAPDFRAALVLRDVQGLSYEEVAEAMHCSLGTVKSRISRAREHMRAYLLECGELPGSGRRL